MRPRLIQLAEGPDLVLGEFSRCQSQQKVSLIFSIVRIGIFNLETIPAVLTGAGRDSMIAPMLWASHQMCACCLCCCTCASSGGGAMLI